MTTQSVRHHGRPTRLVALTLGLVSVGGAFGVSASAAPQATPVVSSTSLLTLEGLAGAGLAADSASLDSTGSALLGDAGRFDGCLGEKSIRNITGAKPYPTKGPAKAYFEGTWTSTLDKEVWVREAITEAPNPTSADRYVAILRSEIGFLADCQGVAGPSPSYGPRVSFTVGAASVDLYKDRAADGSPTGGGSVIVRHGNRVAFVDLSGPPGADLTVLRRVAAEAARQLG